MLKENQRFTMEEFVAHCKTLPKISRRKQCWLHFIATNQLSCVITGLKVAYCNNDVVRYKKSCTHHLNFYTKEGLMVTVDHIIPKSKGGNNDVNNIQPMLELINSFKSNQEVTNQELINILYA